MSRERAIVVFPGRGSYGASELGYLRRRHAGRTRMLAEFDAIVAAAGGEPPTDLDTRDSFISAVHLPGRNASNLIYACALADFAALDRDRYDIVAVCGNSLGWYLTLAAGGALSLADGARLVDAMGALMENEGVGGQLLYPISDNEWRRDPAREGAVEAALAEANTVGRAYVSIRLGGVIVLAGDEAGVRALMSALPKVDERFPLRLPRHAAFHTPLLADISRKALASIDVAFAQPLIPLVDGRGVIWTRGATDVDMLRQYTLGAQITDPFDFSKSLDVALKEFAPKRVILTGPGGALGPPTAQRLIALQWGGLRSRCDFLQRQQNDPIVLSMDRDDQRSLVETHI